jgi:hypothetical protein
MAMANLESWCQAFFNAKWLEIYSRTTILSKILVVP